MISGAVIQCDYTPIITMPFWKKGKVLCQIITFKQNDIQRDLCAADARMYVRNGLSV